MAANVVLPLFFGHEYDLLGVNEPTIVATHKRVPEESTLRRQ